MLGMDQMTFGLDPLPKKTCKEVFLDEMNQVVPWAVLVALIQPHARGAHQALGGRPPFPIETMLRIRCLQLWWNLSDPAMEEELHERPLYLRFVGLDGAARMPDETTILRLRHLLEKHDLAPQVLGIINAGLAQHGLMMKTGTVVDATIIAAPSSTKNKTGERDPEMHQTKKGNQWHFGMKAHIGADAASGLVHSVEGTAANESDISQTHKLLHGQEQTVHADAGYTGVEKRAEIIATHSNVEWRVAARRSKIKAMPESWVKDLSVRFEKLKARARALVEHPFHIIKNLFKHRKARYRGLMKNTAQLHILFAMANLVIAKRRLLGGG